MDIHVLRSFKIAASRLDKEVARGLVSYAQAVPGAQNKSEAQSAFWAPSVTAPEALARRQDMNARVSEQYYRTAPSNLGLQAGVADKFHQIGGGAATRMVQDRKGGPVYGKVEVGRNTGAYLRAGVRGDYDDVYAALVPEEGRTITRKGVDGSLQRAIMQHEFGEASDMARPTVLPHSSHIGVSPILREQMHSYGDHEAAELMGKIRNVDPDDIFVQKAIRRIGGSPERPLALEGKQQRALEKILGTRKEIGTGAKGVAMGLHLQGKDVPAVPSSLEVLKGKAPNLFLGLPEDVEDAGHIAGKRLNRAIRGHARKVTKWMF